MAYRITDVTATRLATGSDTAVGYPRFGARSRSTPSSSTSAPTLSGLARAAGRAARRLGRGDLVHLSHVPARLGGGPGDRARRALGELAEVVQHVLEDTVRAGGQQRLRQQRHGSLVHRRGAHLHGRGRADLVPDPDHVHAGEGQRRDLAGARAGEVDARRART
jgi:hypothetical protein